MEPASLDVMGFEKSLGMFMLSSFLGLRNHLTFYDHFTITSHDYFLFPNKPIYGLYEAYWTSNVICIVLILL
jgi:hypothetical protein